MACEELRPYLRRELGWPLTELGRIRLHRGDVAARRKPFLAAHRAGWDPQPGPRAGASGPGTPPRRPPPSGRPRAPPAGCPRRSGHRTPTCGGAAARGAGRDRDRGRRHRPGPDGRRRAGAHRRPVREQGAGSPAPPSLEDGAARRGRCGGRGALCSRGGATVERGRRALRGGAPASASPTPTRQRQRAELGAPRARTILDEIDTPGRDTRAPGRAARPPMSSRSQAQRLPSRGRLLVGGLRRAHRARARPQGHALPRAAPRRSGPGVPRAGSRRRRDRHGVQVDSRRAADLPRSIPATRARSSTRGPRTPTAGASPRSTTTSSRRAPPATPSGRAGRRRARLPRPRARRGSAWVVVNDEPRPRPSAPGRCHPRHPPGDGPDR